MATFFYPSFEVAKFPLLRDDSSRNTAETWHAKRHPFQPLINHESVSAATKCLGAPAKGAEANHDYRSFRDTGSIN
jgi:hypothetical protein